MKKNPFIYANPIKSKNSFIGRDEELNIILDSITNNINVIITGDRGIGKTSLANRAIESIKKTSLVASFCCTKDTLITDICEGLLNSLMRHLSIDYEIKKNETKIRAQIIPKILSIEESTSHEKNNTINVLNKFIDTISYITKNYMSSNQSICFMIDEYDVLKDNVDISSFIKTTKEHLQREGIVNISFLLVGMRGYVQQLIVNHPSLGRTFANITVPPMKNNELASIIEHGEKISEIKFEEGVKKGIIDLSEGFPSITQLLSYYAYFKNSDEIIDYYDFEKGLSLAIDKLNMERYIDEVEEEHHKIIYAEIIKILSKGDKETFSIDNFSKRISYNENDVLSVLRFLNKNEIIHINNNGTFSIKDRLVLVYYNLKNLDKKVTEFIEEVILSLHKKGYQTEYIGSPTQRNLDIIASKVVRGSIVGLFKRKRKIGILCVVNPNLLSNNFIKNIRKNSYEIFSSKKLDEILIIGERELNSNQKIHLTNSNILYYPFDLFQNAQIDYY
jgi:hypothetical protein